MKDGLTHVQLGMMLTAPYSRPAFIRYGHALRMLVVRGLMEENPTGPGFFRCTEKGEAALQPYLHRRV